MRSAIPNVPKQSIRGVVAILLLTLLTLLMIGFTGACGQSRKADCIPSRVAHDFAYASERNADDLETLVQASLLNPAGALASTQLTVDLLTVWLDQLQDLDQEFATHDSGAYQSLASELGRLMWNTEQVTWAFAATQSQADLVDALDDLRSLAALWSYAGTIASDNACPA